MEQIYKLKNHLCLAYENLLNHLLAFCRIHEKKLLGLYLKHIGVKRQNIDCYVHGNNDYLFTVVTKTQYNTISPLLLLDSECTQEIRHLSKQIKTKNLAPNKPGNSEKCTF